MADDKIEKSQDDIQEHLDIDEQSIISDEVFENLPPEVKKDLKYALYMQQKFSSTTLSNPILKKVNDKHIDKVLDIADKEQDYSFKDEQSSKKYKLFYYLGSIIFIGFLVVFLVDRPELLNSLIEKVIIAAGGIGTGYGYKAYLEKKSK